jgi:hypothetical protein
VRLLARALGLGLGFGVVVAAVDAWLNLPPTLSRGFGPGPAFLLRVAALEIGLAAGLGLAAFPALALPAGRWLHLAVLVLCWAALRRWTTLDSPLFAPMELASPVAAAGLAALGLWLAPRRPRLAWTLAGVLLVSGLFSAPVALRMLRPAVPQRAELPPAPAHAPDVVLIVLDTVRAGNLSTYGYGRPTGDALDALAREGALFLDATSPSTWSLPSHASLFTGRYPSSHRAHAEHRYLDDRYPTLAQVLASNGYETFCITANAWISDGLGLTRGFAWQDESLRAHGGAGLGFSFIHRLLDRLGLQDADKGGGIVAQAFERWASERPADGVRPAFVFLNFIEAHFPYHQLPRDHLFRWSDRPYAELRRISLDLLAAQFAWPTPASCWAGWWRRCARAARSTARCWSCWPTTARCWASTATSSGTAPPSTSSRSECRCSCATRRRCRPACASPRRSPPWASSPPSSTWPRSRRRPRSRWGRSRP